MLAASCSKEVLVSTVQINTNLVRAYKFIVGDVVAQ